MASSDPTPMMMPSVVSAERRALRRSERRAVDGRADEEPHIVARGPSMRQSVAPSRAARWSVDRLESPGAIAPLSALYVGSGGCVDEVIIVEDEPVAHPDDSIGVGGDGRVVRHEDDREPVLAVELAEEAEDLLARLRVEVAGRLIGDQEGAAVDQRAGDRDSLLLAAGEP